MYERMTIQARQLVQRAMADARRLAHRRMGSEHLLLALVAAEAPTAALFHAGGDRDELAAAIIDRYPPRRRPRRAWAGRPRGGR